MWAITIYYFIIYNIIFKFIKKKKKTQEIFELFVAPLRKISL